MFFWKLFNFKPSNAIAPQLYQLRSFLPLFMYSKRYASNSYEIICKILVFLLSNRFAIANLFLIECNSILVQFWRLIAFNKCHFLIVLICVVWSRMASLLCTTRKKESKTLLNFVQKLAFNPIVLSLGLLFFFQTNIRYLAFLTKRFFL